MQRRRWRWLSWELGWELVNFSTHLAEGVDADESTEHDREAALDAAGDHQQVEQVLGVLGHPPARGFVALAITLALALTCGRFLNGFDARRGLRIRNLTTTLAAALLLLRFITRLQGTRLYTSSLGWFRQSYC